AKRDKKENIPINLHPFMHQSTITRLLQLGLSSLKQLSTSSSDGKLASLNDLGLEDNLASLLPHLGSERLSRKDNTSKSNLDVFVGTKLLIEMLSRDTKRAEAVENRNLEASNLGELRVDMEWVAVTRESVES